MQNQRKRQENERERTERGRGGEGGDLSSTKVPQTDEADGKLVCNISSE
jgi:hypothetical protein